MQEREIVAETLFAQQRQARLSKRFDHAMDILDTMHKDFHDHASIHTRIHIQMMLTHLAARRFLSAIVQLLITPTALPASLFQKHAGLVRKGI